MKIKLMRAISPEETGEERCGICALGFYAQSIVAHVVHEDLGRVCPSCVEYLGERNPERFPTLEEYEEAKRHYPEPIWPTDEAASAALDVDNWSEVLDARTWVIRA